MHLGDRALWGSESRWAEIARNMLLTRDFFHPIINEALYFDKPLLSYWLIIVASFATGGLGELATRIPSALAGLLALWATRSLGRRLWTEDVAESAGWILLTSLGFVFWSRTAAADMQNLAAVVLAVAWFFAHERSPGPITYFVFYLICVTGAQMKGLPAIVVPVLALLPWLLREGRWRAHLRVSHLAAALLCGAFYDAPFYWAAHEALPQGYVSQASGLGGLDLVWRENITRFFHPFDHIEPVYLAPGRLGPACFSHGLRSSSPRFWPDLPRSADWTRIAAGSWRPSRSSLCSSPPRVPVAGTTSCRSRRSARSRWQSSWRSRVGKGRSACVCV